MNITELIDTARNLVGNNKGLLAIDESNSTCNKRFAEYGIPQTIEARRSYRELSIKWSILNKNYNPIFINEINSFTLRLFFTLSLIVGKLLFQYAK